MTPIEPFRAPVDWKSLGLFDYPQLIKKPMDLGKIKRKLEKEEYKSIYDAAEDTRFCPVAHERRRPGFARLARSVRRARVTTLLALAGVLLGSLAAFTEPILYLAFGDSITVGKYDNQELGGYPGRLENDVDLLDCAPATCDVINEGEGGERKDIAAKGTAGEEEREQRRTAAGCRSK